MIVTLLNEHHMDYDKKEVIEWENKDCLEGEGGKKEKMTIPSEIDLGEIEKNQVLDNSNLYSLQPISTSTSILHAFSTQSQQSSITAVFLKECPFFPSQAGQEGDKGILRIHGKEYDVMNTVFISIQLS